MSIVNLKPRVLLISEFPPPSAGMTVLAQEFFDRFTQQGYPIGKVATNYIPDVKLRLEKIKGIRGLIRLFFFVAGCRKIVSTDIVHIFSSSGLNFYLFTIIPLILCRVFNKKVIIHYHGGGAQAFFKSRPKLLSFALRKANKLIVPSGYLQEVFKRLGYESEIIGNFANVEKFTYKKRKIIKPVVISVRNFTTVYNIQCAVNAFSKLQTEYAEATLILIGDGPEKLNICQLIEELKLKNVQILGNISNNLVAKYLDQADIFINSSSVDNMPGSIIEAFASGLPVVSTDVGGIGYMVKHDYSGLLSHDNDFETLGQHMIKLVKNPELAQHLTANGKLFIEKLQWTQISRQWTELYVQLADS